MFHKQNLERNEMSHPYNKDDLIRCCRRWFEKHCANAELIGMPGYTEPPMPVYAEHPMLTAIRKTMEAEGMDDRPCRLKTRYFVAESVNGMTRWVADIGESLPLTSEREKLLRERAKGLKADMCATQDRLNRIASMCGAPDPAEACRSILAEVKGSIPPDQSAAQ